MTDVNWTLIGNLAKKPHKHLNITDGCQFTCTTHADDHWIGEVQQEARTVQHLCDLAGIPEGEGYAANIDARVFLLWTRLNAAEDRLARIDSWHSRETAEGGMVGDFCVECGTKWPCDTRRMADGSYVDEPEPAATHCPDFPDCQEERYVRDLAASLRAGEAVGRWNPQRCAACEALTNVNP